jgi:hypothetical protein
MNRLTAWSAPVLAAAMLAGCGDASGPSVGPPSALVRVMGDDQSGAAGKPLSTPVTVRVNDATGQAVAGVVVTFSIQAGQGTVAPSQSQTNADGQAQATWTLGTEAGADQRLQASFSRAEGGTATAEFRATATAGAPVALLKTGGDDQDGGTGAALSDSLTVRVTDEFGNGVPGITVTWTALAGAVSPTTRTTSAQGFASTRWTLGNTAGSMQVQASAGSLPQVTFLANARPVATIAGITPALLQPGGSMVITGTNFPADPAASIVTVAGVNATITAATTTELRATLPTSGFGCIPTGNAVVQLTAGGAVASRSHPVQVVAQRQLNVGEALVSTTLDRLGCVDLPLGGSRYLVAVTNANASVAAHGVVPQPTSSTGFRLNAIAAAQGQDVTQSLAQAPPAAAPAEVLPAGALAGLSAPQQAALRHAVDRKTARQRTHEALVRASNEMVDAARQNPDVLARRLRTSAANAVAVPAVGDLLTMRVPRVEAGTAQMCTQYDEIQARVAYVGQRSIVLEDTANPVKTLDSYYRQLGEEFDQRQYDVIRENFADPLLLDQQLNNDGRLYMLFTRRVDGSRIAGFVWSGDFYDRSQCPQSNHAEIFYGYVPTNANTQYDRGTVGEWWWDIRATVIHEVKHLASFASRISKNVPSEEGWLEEATAMAAEEIWARQVFGYAANGNVGYSESVGCEIRGAFNVAPCVGRPGVMFAHFLLLGQWLGAPDTRSPLGQISFEDGSFYGSGWLLLRHIIENSGRPETEFLSELTQSSTRGAVNLAQRAGRPFTAMLGDWTLAAALDDRAGVDPGPARQIQSWNLRSIFAGLNQEQPQIMPVPFPLVTTGLGFSSSTSNVQSVRGGGTRYFELSGTAGPLALEFLGAGGAALPSGLHIQIFRIE